MKYIKTFENYKSNTKSKDSKVLYLELLPLFTPSYNLENPTGHSLEVIEMTFNKNTNYDDVKDIINNSNWYIVKKWTRPDDDSIRKIEIRPIYSEFYITDYPNIVYHISPSSNDSSILKNGLHSKNKKKKNIYYPDRIYVVSDLKTLDSFSKELYYETGEKEWTIWEISLSNIKMDYIYVDETVNQNLSKPTAFYLQKINIPKTEIKILDKTIFG